MSESKMRELRDQLVADINRPDGRWGMHGHSCVDDDYFQALHYVVGRIDESLAQQPAAGVELSLLKAILPFVATQSIGCHGEKCRELWCHSCNGEFDAELAAKMGAELAFRLSKLIAAHEAKQGGAA